MEQDDDEEGESGVGVTRYPTLPSLIALQQMRNRLTMAHNGKRLMKWSAMATGRELRKVAANLQTVYATFAEDMGNAYMLLARCRYYYPNMNKMVVEIKTQTACVTVGKSVKSVAGCKATMYKIEEHCPNSFPCLGIDKGGEAIEEARQAWRQLLLTMITMEQLRSNFHVLDESHKSATKKTNVLGKIIIPRTSLTIRYILAELEEMAREEFFRLKKMLEVKYRTKQKFQPRDSTEEEPVRKPPEKPKVRLPPEPPKLPPIAKPPPPPPQPPTPPPPPVIKKQPQLPPPPPMTPPPPPMTLPPVCIICNGPMHPEVKKKLLTEEEINRENAALAELKQTLSRVLSATEEYEKKTAKSDTFKEFKQTTSDLRAKLNLTPKYEIPDDINVEKLCDICKELYNEQKTNKTCIICGEPKNETNDKILAVAKESKRKLKQQLDTVLDLVSDYEIRGLAGDKIKDFKQTAAELKVKLEGPPIPPDVDLDKLCKSCKERYNQAYSPEPKVGRSMTNSEHQTPQESEITLGVFETEEITEVIKVLNPDGTISEKRREVTIKRKLEDVPNQNDDQEESGTSSFKDKKSIGLATIIYHRNKAFERPKNKDYTVSRIPMRNRMIKECVSSNFDLGFEDALDSMTVLAPKSYGGTNSYPSSGSFSDTYRNIDSPECSRVYTSARVRNNSDDSIEGSGETKVNLQPLSEQSDDSIVD